MHSIRTKTILLNVIAIVSAITVATVISAVTITNMAHHSTEENLKLQCEKGKSKFNYYFDSIKQSADTISALVETDLANIDEADFVSELPNHIQRADVCFKTVVEKTNTILDENINNGILTYYYRFDPEVTNEKGFWYSNLDNTEYKKEEPSDITKLNPESDENKWFFTPKETQQSVWLNPYSTDNLEDVYVISYNVPIFKKVADNKKFIGVVGIEIDYDTICKQLKDVVILNTGYVFVTDKNGNIIYHPSISRDQHVAVPSEISASLANKTEQHVVYRYKENNKTVEKHAYWDDGLENGTIIIATVPLTAVNSVWQNLLSTIIIAGLIIILVFIIVTIFYSRHFTKPLMKLAEAAEDINNGNYNVKLDYKDDDEMGVLTNTFNHLIEHLGEYVADLNSLAYADALTNVSNKSAFDVRAQELQALIDSVDDQPEFAIAIIDCDDLKPINDTYGHDKGNVYLKNTCNLITRVFQNSLIYRIGGDEFAVILQNQDFKNREKLRKSFLDRSKDICSFAKEPWEQIRASIGIAVYNRETDKSVNDVANRADRLMYENKHQRKNK